MFKVLQARDVALPRPGSDGESAPPRAPRSGVMAVVVRVVYCGAWGYKPKYPQLKKKLEDEFPSRLDIYGEGTPQVTGFFEVFCSRKAGSLQEGRRWPRGHGEQVSEAGGRHQSCFGAGLMCPEGNDP